MFKMLDPQVDYSIYDIAGFLKSSPESIDELIDYVKANAKRLLATWADINYAREILPQLTGFLIDHVKANAETLLNNTDDFELAIKILPQLNVFLIIYLINQRNKFSSFEYYTRLTNLLKKPEMSALLAHKWSYIDLTIPDIKALKNAPEALKAKLLAGNAEEGLAIGFRRACENGQTGIVKACIEAIKDDPETLNALLEASIDSFNSACKNGYAEIVKACLEVSKKKLNKLHPLLVEERLGFYLACEKGHAEIVGAFVDVFKDCPEDIFILAYWLLGVGGIAETFHRACENRHTKIVKIFIEASKKHPKFRRVMLVGDPGQYQAISFIRACQNGHIDIVRACIEGLEDMPEAKEAMLLAGNDKKGRALGFRGACKKGYTDIAIECIKALINNRSALAAMLLAGNAKKGGALGFRRACKNGLIDVVKASIEALKDNPEALEQMLLAGHPNGFIDAFRMGHTDIVKACIEALEEQPKALRKMLAGEYARLGPVCIFLDCKKGDDIGLFLIDVFIRHPDLLIENSALNLFEEVFSRFDERWSKHLILKLAKLELNASNNNYYLPAVHYRSHILACINSMPDEDKLNCMKAIFENRNSWLSKIMFHNRWGFRPRLLIELERKYKLLVKDKTPAKPSAKSNEQNFTRLEADFIRACEARKTQSAICILEEAKRQYRAVAHGPSPAQTSLGSCLTKGLIRAYSTGQFALVMTCIEALNDEPEALKTILLAECSESGPAWCFRMACFFGHTTIVIRFIEALRGQPDTLRDMLLAGNSLTGPASGFVNACNNGFTEIAQAHIEALKPQPEALRTILSAYESAAKSGRSRQLDGKTRDKIREIYNEGLNFLRKSEYLPIPESDDNGMDQNVIKTEKTKTAAGTQTDSSTSQPDVMDYLNLSSKPRFQNNSSRGRCEGSSSITDKHTRVADTDPSAPPQKDMMDCHHLDFQSSEVDKSAPVPAAAPSAPSLKDDIDDLFKDYVPQPREALRVSGDLMDIDDEFKNLFNNYLETTSKLRLLVRNNTAPDSKSEGIDPDRFPAVPSSDPRLFSKENSYPSNQNQRKREEHDTCPLSI